MINQLLKPLVAIMLKTILFHYHIVLKSCDTISYPLLENSCECAAIRHNAWLGAIAAK